MHIQVIKRGAETWELNKVTEIWRGVHEYETIGRVIRDGDSYYAELAEWHKDGFKWIRQPRAYLIPRAAYRAVIDWKEKVVQ